MERRGTISAHDIHVSLHENATPRDWSYTESTGTDGILTIHIYGGSKFIAPLRGFKARENADLIVGMRNTLPEHIACFEHLMDRIHLLERELETRPAKEKLNGNDHHQAGKGTRVRVPKGRRHLSR